MIDPNIALQVRQPEFSDPLQSYAKIAGVRNMITQNALHQQQIATSQEALKTHQLANAEATRAQGAQRLRADLTAKNTTQGENGEPVTDDFAVMQGLRAAGHEKEADAVDVQRRANLTSKIADTAANLKNIKEKAAQVASRLGPLVNAPPDQAAAMFPAIRAQGIKDGLSKEQDIPENYDPAWVQQNFQKAIEADKQVDNHLNALKFAQEVNEKAPKTVKEWSDVALNQASAARSQNELDQTRQILESQGAPKAILAQIPAMWSQASADQLAAKAMTAQQRTEEADKKAVRDQTKAHELVTEKQGQQRINLQGQRNARDQKIYENTYGEGSNEALRGVEPKLRVPATKEAQKAADDFNKAQTAATDMQTFLDMARSGNKAAGSNLPLVGVSTINALNGIKRINQAEIRQYEGAGSLLDRIQGKIEKLTVGQPIPADVLNDIESLHKTLAGNSVDQYNKRLEGINQNYRSSFKPVPGPKAAAKMIQARDPQGNLHEAAEGTALPAGWKLEGSK